MRTLIYSLLYVLTFAGCQMKLERVAPATPTANDTKTTTVKPQGGSSVQGGGDTVGGGSIIKFKNMESYAKKVQSLNSFNLVVKPLVEKLKVQFPRLAADFIHLVNERTWYFIPTALDKIKSELIGTYTPSVDQAALQDLNQVWFDSTLFDQMESEEQGRLIVHELVMGAHLLEFTPRVERCYAKAALNLFEFTADAQTHYADAAHDCKKNYGVGVDQVSHQFSLSAEDYMGIRKVVIELISENPNWSEVKQILEDFKLRDYND